MKLITYREANQDKRAIAIDDKVYKLEELGFTEEFWELDFEKVKAATENAQAITLNDIQITSPIPYPKQDIICLGINYAEHAEESARYKKDAFLVDRKYATYFSKRVNRAVGSGEDVDSHSDIVERLDYEVELAVVIGKDCYNVKETEVYDYILGYTILNDISARDIQTRYNQWYFGKSLDDFTPIGPWIVTEDEFERPPVLPIRSYVNGELRQNSTTGMLIHGIEEVVCELSKGMTLKAGTIIATGTPAGVGMGFVPPKFLSHGDEVICEIEGIGRLINVMK